MSEVVRETNFISILITNANDRTARFFLVKFGRISINLYPPKCEAFLFAITRCEARVADVQGVKANEEIMRSKED